jgi:hypothetical protein
VFGRPDRLNFEKGERFMIKPTVGRVVWFYPLRWREGQNQPLAAIIAHVWTETCVNLAVFGVDGHSYPVGNTNVFLVQEGQEVPSGVEYCTYMPGR